MYVGDPAIMIFVDPAKYSFKKQEKVVVFNWFNQKPPFNSGTECLPYSPELELDLGGAAKLVSKPGDDIRKYNIGVYRIKKIHGNIIYVV